ncbi:unnamed protein product [Rhizoctonia solani]|uniref:Uncharacterized protein n=1 Tax=Rhizoctonia solani TaxID=456999 RepID=A0A8H2WVB4_9AGAM|nr:unnamed protein product [Rhizoctonia solani]
MAVELAIKSLDFLTELLPRLLARVPPTAARAPPNELQLQEMEARLQRLEATIQELSRGIDARDQAFDRISQNIATMNRTIRYNYRLAYARAFNASASEGASRVAALPPPDNSDVPAGLFPETVNGFIALGGHDLGLLFALYELPTLPTADDRLRALADYCCIQL